MKARVLKILRYSDRHVSGQEICKLLGVSRTTVWNIIQQLKEEGYKIEAISNKGYRIIDYPDIITAEEVSSQMTTAKIGRKVIYFEETDSTNTRARYFADEKDSDGLLIISEEQKAGKGRRGRSWSSPKGTGIWMSVILKPDMKPMDASMITLVTALAVAKAIEESLQIKAYIKWPNDILIEDKKVCGILTEMSSERDYINYVVVGIGINGNTACFPEEIKDIATSLFLEGNKMINRSQLIVSIMKQFEQYYEVFLKTMSMIELVTAYNSLLVNKDRMVKILEGNKEAQGIALGINNAGQLLVKNQKEVLKVTSGEVSVRGIYGYV